MGCGNMTSLETNVKGHCKLLSSNVFYDIIIKNEKYGKKSETIYLPIAGNENVAQEVIQANKLQICPLCKTSLERMTEFIKKEHINYCKFIIQTREMLNQINNLQTICSSLYFIKVINSYIKNDKTPFVKYVKVKSNNRIAWRKEISPALSEKSHSDIISLPVEEVRIFLLKKNVFGSIRILNI